MPNPNKRQPMRGRVAQFLREMIHNGELPAGQRLAEEKLARLAGTSRTPVREALQTLEKESLVTRRKGGGYEVKPFTAEELKELVGVRSVLESYAVKLAARHLTPRLLKHLETNLKCFEAALKAGDKTKLVELNTDFHDTFYQAANNRILYRLINEVADGLHRFRVALLSDPQAAAQALTDHRRILEALQKRSYDQAAKAAEEHLLTGGRWMLTWLGEKDALDL